jgi:hypothetical protein
LAARAALASGVAGARAALAGGAAGTRGGGAGHACWRPAVGVRALVGSGNRKRDARAGVRDLGWLKFDGVHVAHVFNLRMWVPTFLKR